MSSVWLVLVHPYHDYLIDVSVHATQQDAKAHAELIKSAMEEKQLERQTWLHARNKPGGSYKADLAYTDVLVSFHSSWEPRLGQDLYDQLSDIESVEITEKEIHTMPDYADQYVSRDDFGRDEFDHPADQLPESKDKDMVTLAELKSKINELKGEKGENNSMFNSFHNVLGLYDDQEIISVRPTEYLVEVRTVDEYSAITTTHTVSVS